MTAELAARLQAIPGVADVFDTKLSNEYDLTDPIIVASVISDNPTTAIDSQINMREQRWTFEVQAADLGDARAIKEALITALNGWSGGPISSCLMESAGPELYDYELIPPRYCLPVDFMILT